MQAGILFHASFVLFEWLPRFLYYHLTMHPPSPYRTLRLVSIIGMFTLIVSCTDARAQIRLPRVDLPITNRLGPLDTTHLRASSNRLLATDGIDDIAAIPALRLQNVTQLLRTHRDVLEADPRGEAIVRHEILAWSPSALGLTSAISAGLLVIRTQTFDALGQTLIVLSVPANANTAATLDSLRALDPDGLYDFNHIYTGSAANSGDDASTAATQATTRSAQTNSAAPVSVGLVDSGVDPDHLVFRHLTIHRWGCNDVPHPSGHGTAVAALMVGQSTRFHGVLAQATLYAADIYCDSVSGAASGTGGSADKIAGALAWLAKQNVAVINLSLVGPANRALERMVSAMLERGHLLVAAVGNDGPAAAPLYPASYAGMIGVSAVDQEGRSLPEAARGAQVMFAAPGSNMVSAAIGTPPYRQVRGTSFAAPIVAALLAGMHTHPDKAGAKKAVALLARQANPIDATRRNDDIGYGVVGASYRSDPQRFR